MTEGRYQDALERLDALCTARGYDWGLRADIAAECAWGAELRITWEPNNPDGPDVSTVWFGVGHESAERAILDVLQAALSHLARGTANHLATLDRSGELPVRSQSNVAQTRDSPSPDDRR